MLPEQLSFPPPRYCFCPRLLHKQSSCSVCVCPTVRGCFPPLLSFHPLLAQRISAPDQVKQPCFAFPYSRASLIENGKWTSLSVGGLRLILFFISETCLGSRSVSIYHRVGYKLRLQV